MKQLTGNQVRQMFLDFFESKGHMIEPGASLVPVNDPSLLWINAGVAALKKYFDGTEKPRCNRICNAQKSIRTNDIENVGKTARHHTFFEMLGNFSIGDYFKEDALKFAYEFLTSPKYIGFDPKRLYVTVYIDDTEAYRIWTEVIGFDPTHILRTPENFWEIGEGPSGPDSEIFYDRGEKYDPEHLGERAFFEELENDRYIEVWNVVFSQYDAKEGVDRKDYKELPQKNIDTGMGLERLVALIQDGETNFDTDLFLPIIHETEKLAKVKYEGQYKMAYRVIADHIRTVTFALSDGASFSNEGRGYVLRRVLRRACRFARVIGIDHAFMYNLVDIVCQNMHDFYPYLDEKKEYVKKLVKKEEEMFLQTLANGEKLLNEELAKVENNKLKGEVIFKLYDTYGFPKEITIEIAEEKGIECDLDGFNECMERQREMARNARNTDQSMHNQSQDLLNYEEPFEFTGYTLNEDDAKAVAFFKDGVRIDEIQESCEIIFDRSCFYAESGGQVADTGIISNDRFKAEVLDVKKAPHGQFLHHVHVLEGTLELNESVHLAIDYDRRQRIRANHSSIHLLQSALIKVLGDHVQQAGSYCSEKYGRFDFTQSEKITPEQLEEIERLVNSYIMAELPVVTRVLPIEEAKKLDAIALFDEKYDDLVRVVSMGDVSTEFCGGTHVSNTQNLGCYKILSEESVGSGIRRITSCTKLEAYDTFAGDTKHLNGIAGKLGLKSKLALDSKVDSLLENISDLEHQVAELKNSLINYQADELINNAKVKGDLKCLFVKLDNSSANIKDFAATLRNKLIEGVVFVANVAEDKVTFAAAVSKKAIEEGFNASDLVKKAATMAEGKGGGKPDLAQSGGKNLGNIDTIMQTIENEVL